MSWQRGDVADGNALRKAGGKQMLGFAPFVGAVSTATLFVAMAEAARLKPLP